MSMQAEIWAEIRRLSLVEKVSISEIARRLRVSRKTARKALASEVCPQRIKAIADRPSKLDTFRDYINERLEKYPQLPASVVYEEIKGRGYGGKLRILEEYLQGLKKKTKESFLRIETLPGEYAQVDWANCGTVQIGKAIRKLSCFVMVLSFSRLMYLEFTLSQCLEDFIACHINAFKFFGGVTKKVLYDNLKTVVLSRLGNNIQFNPKFMEFAGIYLFEPRLCNPRRGNEKGKVESGVKYIRSSFLSGRETKSAWPAIKGDAIGWLKATANVRMHRTTRERPLDRFEKEQSFLAALPLVDYDASIIRTVKATSQALLHFDGNAYSVPYSLAYKPLTLKALPDTIRIFDGTKEVAEHKRSYERGLAIEDPKHYEGLLAIKRKAHASKIKDSFLTLGDLAKAYLEGLIKADLNLPHHLAQIMDWVRLYGKTEVLQAIDHALSFKAFGSAYLQNIILQQRAARGLKETSPIIIPAKPAWTQLSVEEQDLSLYDEMFEEQPTINDERSRTIVEEKNHDQKTTA